MPEAACIKTVAPSEFFNEHGVYLNVYDMSKCFLRPLIRWSLGERFQGIWHTGVEVFGLEYFYGGGVYKIDPSKVRQTMGMERAERRFLGSTGLGRNEIEAYIRQLLPVFNERSYDLLSWNCNNFSDTLTRRLVGCGIGEEFTMIGVSVRGSALGRCLARCAQSLAANQAR